MCNYKYIINNKFVVKFGFKLIHLYIVSISVSVYMKYYYYIVNYFHEVSQNLWEKILKLHFVHIYMDKLFYYTLAKNFPRNLMLSHCACLDWRLEMMFERAEQRSTELENSYALLDRWKNKSDELLYSMIPQTVADRLRAGASPLSTCEVFQNLLKYI